MNSSELCFTPATELALMIRSKEISPVEVTQAVLDRIDSINPQIHAYITVVPELALEAARECEKAMIRGETLGPLHGIPLSIKDLTPTRGVRTTGGSKYYKNFVPEEDALVVRRLKMAGAVIVGKTNTPEFGIGINATNSVFGTTLNPWDFSSTAGGSSGGAAAALAAGLGPLAEGSDLAGSLRIPASYCGVIGFRPSPGLIPRYPNPWGWDCFAVLGPMARTVPDTALLLSVMAGPDDLDPISLPQTGADFLEDVRGDWRGRRVAWTPDLKGLCRVEPEVVRICSRAAKKFEELGCRVEESSPDFTEILQILPPLRIFWTAAIHANLLEIGDEVENQFLKQFLSLSSKTSSLEIAIAERKRTELWLKIRAFFEKYDLLLCPTTSTPAFPAEHLFPQKIAGKAVENRVESYLLTYAFSFTGLPAISVPAGWTEKGLPVGLQIVGKRLGERSVLRAAANFERIAPWANRRPRI
jgi:amidase